MRKRTTTAVLGAAVLAGALALPQPALAAHGVTQVATGFALPTQVDVEGRTAYVADAALGTVTAVDLQTGARRTVTSIQGFTPGVGVRRGEVFVAATSQDTGLFRVGRDGTARLVADLLEHELEENPDGQEQEVPTGPCEEGGPDCPDAVANPYAVLALPGRVLVADAAANAILSVSPQGQVRTLAVLPNITTGACATVTNNGVPGGGCDAVPTDIALGPDGHLYVSGLGGEVEGRVWKVNQGGKVVQTWTGLPPLTGVAVDRTGTVYASSLFAGAVFRLPAQGGAPTGVAQVPGPTGLDLEGGVLYATSVDFGGGPGGLYRIRLDAFH